MSESAPTKRLLDGESSTQDALDRVAKRLKVRKQTLLKELQAEFRLPVSKTSPTALPPDYGSQIYDWLDAHDDEDESDSEDYSDAVEAQNEASSAKHLSPSPVEERGKPGPEKENLAATSEPARPISQEEERKALLDIFRASSSGSKPMNPGNGKGRQPSGAYFFGSDVDSGLSPPAASENGLDPSDDEKINSFLEHAEGGTELAFEPKTTTSPSETFPNKQEATPSAAIIPGLEREAFENDSRLKESSSSAPFVTGSKRTAQVDDNIGTVVTPMSDFVTKSKRRNLIDDDEGVREIESVETKAVKFFKSFFGYFPTTDPWKAHQLAKGPGKIDPKNDRDQTMIRRVAAIMVGAPTKWVSFTVLPSARHPAAPVRFQDGLTWPLVKATAKNQAQASQIYPMNCSIQVISEGLPNKRGDEFKQKQSEKARQIWEKRKQALARESNAPEESLNIPGGSSPRPSSKSLAERERAEEYYQKHRQRLREARARQKAFALDSTQRSS